VTAARDENAAGAGAHPAAAKGTTTAKGERRRAELAQAAAAIVREEGPGALTHRAVAARAGASLSATTYYFTGLDDLLTAAGQTIVASWVEHARAVAAQAVQDLRGAGAPPDQAARLLASAVLPPGDDDAVRAHYEHLLGAGRVPALARAIAAGRGELDEVVAQVVRLAGADVSPALVVAVVDGAVVTALTEQRPVRPGAAALLAQVLPGGS